MADAAPAVRVFISYSRRDSAFAGRLAEALQSKGYDVSVDTEDISGGEAWRGRLDQLILNADVVAYIMSPDSVASEICHWEVNRTLELGKRLIPVLWRTLDTQSPPPNLSERNYIFFDDEARFESALTQLCNACDVDIAWVREHTRLTELAQRWHTNDRKGDGLLRGGDLKSARAWMAARAPRAPEIPATIQDYVSASEREEKRARGARFRTTAILGTVSVLLIATVAGFVTQNQWRPVVDAAMGRYTYYDVLLPQTVSERIDVNSRVIFNGIDVGAVQRLMLYPDDPQVIVARVVMSRDVPIRADSAVEVRASNDGQPQLVITIDSGSPNAPLLPGSDGQAPPPRLIAIHGDNADAFIQRASIYKHEDRIAEALADYDEAIRLDPQLASAYYARALTHGRAGDAAASAADHDRAAALEPTNARYLTAACRAQAELGAHLDQALSHCNAALLLRPSNADTLDGRGLTHLRRGDFQAAFDDYDAALRANADSPSALYGRGLALLRRGQRQAGLADLNVATAQDPTIVEYFAAFGLTQ